MEYKEFGHRLFRINQLRRWHNAIRMKDEVACYWAQLPLLEFIISNPGCCQKTIADNFALSRAAITKSVKILIKNGIVTRDINEGDERQYCLYATEKGVEIKKMMRDTFNEVDKQAFNGFSEEEFQQMVGFLQRISENLETDYSRGKSPGTLMKDICNIEKEK